MTKWEYKVARFIPGTLARSAEKEIENILDKMGRDGWEMVNFETCGDEYRLVCIFKRKCNT